ncbi:hypothetical protein A9P82_09015 [Arachidicoccus ginsenosidimutans]|uniref:M56 family metallopeptidase n=1 Tax=Arachidicoccus sp. BS20 TaxID=1850526 RepID=UPI0007F0EC57|nr:M56 family metallopeptidase [Arachidicoccus sp. BS20]ANI89424.1 hypothetical protein A9P82_09015 [Arachidicoccus sp. BS20]
MITYFIKCVVCSGLLLGVYALFLEREKMHRFNRLYLLAAWIVSWFIPLITFKMQAPKVVEQIQHTVLPATNNFVPNFVPEQSSEILMNTEVQQTSINYLPMILWSIYGIVTLILLIRFVMNMAQINRLIRKNVVQKFADYSLVLVPNNAVSFSFFNYIFPAESDYENGQIEHSIFLHEMVHARKMHSIDILFMELCKVFLWFNPSIFLYKRAIQLNHEFLADEVVVENNNVVNYQNLLLSKITQIPISQLVSSSNYSITKKRFIMMTKRTKRIKAMCLKLGIIPVAGIMIFGFSKKVVTNPKATAQKDFSETVVPFATNDENDSDIVSAYKTLYNSIIQKGKADNGYDSIHYDGSRSQFLRLQSMYQSMDASQKAKVGTDTLPIFAIIALDNPHTYPKQQRPTETQIKKWSAHPELWAIWYNDERIKNTDLKNYSKNELAHYRVDALAEYIRPKMGYNVEIHIYDQAHYEESTKGYQRWQDPIRGTEFHKIPITKTVIENGVKKSFTPPTVVKDANYKVPSPPPYPYIKGKPINPPMPPKYIVSKDNISEEQYESFTYMLRSTWSRKDLPNGKYERGYNIDKETLEKLYPLYEKMSAEQKVGIIKIPSPDELKSSSDNKIFIIPSIRLIN